MTNNQINYARNLEEARHNKEMEKQGWHTAESSRISANANQLSAESNWRNAGTNEKQLDINWYEAGTNARNADTNQGNLLARLDEVEIKRDDLERQKAKDLRDYIIASRELANKRAQTKVMESNARTNAKNAATNRANMWFSAASSMLNSTIGDIGRVTRYLTK